MAEPEGSARRMTAADLMTPHPRSCSSFSTTAEAALIFREADCGAVPVLEEGRPCGILTDRDLALAVAEFPDLPARPVSDVMSKRAVTVRDTAPLEEVKAKFGESGVRRCLVLDAQDQLVGLIAWADLVAHLPSADVGRSVSDLIEHPAEVGAGSLSAADRDSARFGDDHVRPSPFGRISWSNLKALWYLIRKAGVQWSEHRGPRLGAALAYYMVFSIAPLLLIAIGVAGLFFGKRAAQGEVADQIQYLVGPQAAQVIGSIIANASRPGRPFTATALSFVLLLFAAMGVFLELQDSMNTIWEVTPKPGRGWLGVLRDHLLSFCLVMGTIVLMLVSVLISASVAALENLVGVWFSSSAGQGVEFLVSFGVITILFAMIFRFVPDAHIAWSDVWLGAAITSLLFAVGKTLLGLYLGHSTVASLYGAAGSLVALMIWAYYSAQIFLFGAEVTRAYANRFGQRIVSKGGNGNVPAHARSAAGGEHRREKESEG